jgi:hypothetical protein
MIRTDPQNKDALLLLPLRKICKSAEEVAEVIHRVFEDIKAKKRLSDFQATKKLQQGVGGALVDAAILQPKLGGIGFDLKRFFGGIRK